MVDLLTGKTAAKQLELQQSQIAAAQRTSLAQISAEQGNLDQQAAGAGRRRRGRGLLTFVNSMGGAGQATLG